MERQRILEIAAAALFVLLLVVASVVVVSAYRNPKTETTITNSYNTYNNYQNPQPVVSYSHAYGKPYIVDDGYNYRRTRDYSRIYYFDDSRYDGYDKKYYRDYDDRYYDRDREYYEDKNRDRYDDSDRRYLRYDDFGDLRTYKGIVDNRVHSYEVYVRNRDYAGGYFKTTFYFEDYYGNVDSKSVRHYIPAREEKKFALKDVSPGRYDYRSWWYEIESQSKTPSGNY